MEPGDHAASLPVPPLGLLARLRTDRRVAFLGAGAFNTAFAFAVFAGLELTLSDAVPYLVVLLLAHVIGVLEAFVVYRRRVFKVTGNVLGDLARFESVYLAALAVNAALLPLLVEGAGLPVIGAQGVIVTVTSVMSFVGHDRFSFRRDE